MVAREVTERLAQILFQGPAVAVVVVTLVVRVVQVGAPVSLVLVAAVVVVERLLAALVVLALAVWFGSGRLDR